MPKFSANMLQQVKSLDILTFISRYVELRNAGRTFVGLCPFHNEKTPSFHVIEDRGFFNCFGCGAKGDIIEFTKLKFGYSFFDAVIFLAQMHGIEVEYADGANFEIHSRQVNDIHADILEIARRCLYSPMGEEARKYIFSRGFNDELANDFLLGFLPNNTNFDALLEKYGAKALVETGFFKESRYDKPFSRFFNRLVLPIKSLTGQIIAFAGRSLDGSMPKYLNSAEGLLFHKGSTLFNIDQAKGYIKKSGIAIIVEGYFDVMRLHSVGIKNAVAPMGTSLTKEQISLLKRYAEEIVVIFDGDAAGQKAANRSLENFVTHSTFPSAVFLPKEEDPDSFILKYGRKEFDNLFEKREDLFLNRCSNIAEQSNGKIFELLKRFESIKKLLAKSNNRHLEDYYVERVAEILGLKNENVQEDIAKERKQKKIANELSIMKSPYICERDFLSLLSCVSKKEALNIVATLPIDMIVDLEVRSIYERLLRELSDIEDMGELFDRLGGKYIDIAMRVPPNLNKTEILHKLLINRDQIERSYLKRSLTKIDKEMALKNPAQKLALVEEKQKMVLKILELEKNIARLQKDIDDMAGVEPNF